MLTFFENLVQFWTCRLLVPAAWFKVFKIGFPMNNKIKFLHFLRRLQAETCDNIGLFTIIDHA